MWIWCSLPVPPPPLLLCTQTLNRQSPRLSVNTSLGMRLVNGWVEVGWGRVEGGGGLGCHDTYNLKLHVFRCWVRCASPLPTGSPPSSMSSQRRLHLPRTSPSAPSIPMKISLLPWCWGGGGLGWTLLPSTVLYINSAFMHDCSTRLEKLCIRLGSCTLL